MEGFMGSIWRYFSQLFCKRCVVCGKAIPAKGSSFAPSCSEECDMEAAKHQSSGF
uniref:DUF2116 family Zn-ribbon domain-containing protein n=1 Tax=Terriglobus tenax TaxID=1111115 RepID=UPI0037DA1707